MICNISNQHSKISNQQLFHTVQNVHCTSSYFQFPISNAQCSKYMEFWNTQSTCFLFGSLALCKCYFYVNSTKHPVCVRYIYMHYSVQCTVCSYRPISCCYYICICLFISLHVPSTILNVQCSMYNWERKRMTIGHPLDKIIMEMGPPPSSSSSFIALRMRMTGITVVPQEPSAIRCCHKTHFLLSTF